MKNKVYWITGLSGAGKTTLGKTLYGELKKNNSNIVFVDGDEMREVFGNDLNYSIIDRKKCAMRYSRLCKMLSSQGLIVVCCTISMFSEIREWNRKNIDGYVEVYLKVSMDTLKERNQKGMYSDFYKGKNNNVVGLDINMQEPENPDIIIENNGNNNIFEYVKQILNL